MIGARSLFGQASRLSPAYRLDTLIDVTNCHAAECRLDRGRSPTRAQALG
jgi:hypothetical protein